jgi:hypothetical protein
MNKVIILLLGVFIGSCYSFKGISIPETVKTYYVPNAIVSAVNTPPNIEVAFAERLRNKIRQESRLINNNNSPDVEFNANILKYELVNQGISNQGTASIQRIQMEVKVDYVSNVNEKDNWSQTFRHFIDFPVTTNLADVQENLIRQLNDQLTEDIFNKAFTNW